MKRYFCVFLALVLSLFLNQADAQILDPVQWEFSQEKTEDGNDMLIFKAKIDEGWKLYGRDIPEGGPIATTITFEDSSKVEFIDDLQQLGREEKAFEPLFDMDLSWFKKRVIFRQTVKFLDDTPVKGYVEFMTCDDRQCLPPAEVEFEFVKPKAEVESTGEEQGGILEPVIWEIAAQNVEGKHYVLNFKATIEKGWKLYGQEIAEGGPIPTSFHFDDSTNTTFKLKGLVKEDGDLHKAFEPLFGMDLQWYKESVLFAQTIESTNAKKFIEGYLEYMTCDDRQCLPPQEVPFRLNLETGLNELAATGTTDVNCFDYALGGELNIENETASKSYMVVFLLGLLGGFVALFTPCVFPMIPLTVSFFTKKGGDRKKGIVEAIFYGFCIVLVYFLFSLPFLIFELPGDTLNIIATNPVLNLLFFAIFAVFAFSFFGYFELTLPASLANKVDSASNVGGFVGIFFMALTLAIVSFSCTGPILGGLLGASLNVDGGSIKLVYGMVGFGVALALPFALFAIFPNMLNSLPRSGGWLNTVKVVLGFLELGLALKFFSNADLVMHWGLLKREIFIGLWVIIGILIVLYMFGKIKFPHDSPMQKIGKGRLVTAALSLAFVIYLIPGLWGKNLKLISGFPPPMFYSFFYNPDTGAEDGDKSKVFHHGQMYFVDSDMNISSETGEQVSEKGLSEEILVAKEEFDDCPLGLFCFHDFEEGVAYAQMVSKPIMIDFTGWACVNCRRMEENVWVNESVNKKLSDDYVLISLYVDDKRKLPEEEQYVSCKTEKVINTVGKKWADMQQRNFNNNSQPYYVLLSPDMELLNKPVGYTPDVNDYIQFLDQGIAKFKGEGTLAENI